MVGPTNPSEEHFHRGIWGFDGDVWRKLQLLFGFGGIVEESLSDTNLDAGLNSLKGALVPAGEIWVVQNAMISYVGTAPTKISIVVTDLAVSLALLAIASPVSGQDYCWGGTCILQEGDQMSAWVTGATAGDDLYFRYAGYRMEIE